MRLDPQLPSCCILVSIPRNWAAQRSFMVHVIVNVILGSVLAMVGSTPENGGLVCLQRHLRYFGFMSVPPFQVLLILRMRLTEVTVWIGKDLLNIHGASTADIAIGAADLSQNHCEMADLAHKFFLGFGLFWHLDSSLILKLTNSSPNVFWGPLTIDLVLDVLAYEADVLLRHLFFITFEVWVAPGT